MSESTVVPLRVSSDEAPDSLRDAGRIKDWNYRIVRTTCGDEESFSVIEAYYDEKEHIVAWARAVPDADTLADLRLDLTFMVAATHKPVIEETDLPRERPK